MTDGNGDENGDAPGRRNVSVADVHSECVTGRFVAVLDDDVVWTDDPRITRRRAPIIPDSGDRRDAPFQYAVDIRVDEDDPTWHLGQRVDGALMTTEGRIDVDTEISETRYAAGKAPPGGRTRLTLTFPDWDADEKRDEIEAILPDDLTDDPRQ